MSSEELADFVHDVFMFIHVLLLPLRMYKQKRKDGTCTDGSFRVSVERPPSVPMSRPLLFGSPGAFWGILLLNAVLLLNYPRWF